MVECESCEFNAITHFGKRWKLEEGVEGKKPDKWTCPKCGHITEYGF